MDPYERPGWIRRNAGWIFASVFIAVIASLLFLSFSSSRYLPFEYPPPFSFFFFGWWIFIPLFFFGFFFVFRWWGRWWYGGEQGHYRLGYDPAIETLRDRFARGEITKEQFEQMKEDLERTR